MADGHLNKCKTCTKKDVKAVPFEVKRQYEARRNAKSERKAARTRYAQARRAKWPGKYQANTAVGNAVRDGRLVKLPCRRCGSKVRVQAHHKDYRKKLDVEWLCFKCHRFDAHGSK
jgi:hypothetical protein